MRTALFALVLALAACGPSPGPAVREGATAEPAASSQAEDEPQPVDTLAGSWRVAAIDDQPYEAFMPFELYGNDTRIYWDPPCAGQERLYTIDGSDFSAEVAASEAPPILCDAVLPERLAEVWRAFDNARAIEPTPEGGVRISGGGYSVTLVRQ